ncbi:hypothetical protein VW23_003590 [Devosia insulae DS-56]|uniref:DNA-binding response regulator n=1 Tax=Devosia insulae DS-56 TaxID=1116389 RepID=A0A1E5XJF4_9HYPH|nr:LuxR C-terminal-related transcriptional regulator [Devosia insulae]OEO28715.1 hypothetical protein VW23_003590 [Devosia insulae DS-56]
MQNITPKESDLFDLSWRNLTPMVVVVHQDTLVRRLVTSLAESAGWHSKNFGSPLDFLAEPRIRVPSCLVLDVALPGISGLQLLRQIADRREMPVIFITAHADVQTTVQAMKDGAREFFTTPLAGECILDALRWALERSRTIIEDVCEIELLRERHTSLSEREKAVMALVVEGQMNKQIAFELGISEITVKAHRGRMVRKMGAHSVPDLVRMSARLNTPVEVVRTQIS